MYLQLADNSTTTDGPYIAVPTISGLKYVREDLFDDLDSSDWNSLMSKLAPYQPQGGLSELSDKATRERRKEARTQKKEAKTEKKQAKVDDIKSGDRAKRRKDSLDKVTGILGKIGSTLIGGTDNTDTSTDTSTDTAPASSNTSKYLLYGGIGLAVLVGGYFLLRKK